MQKQFAISAIWLAGLAALTMTNASQPAAQQASASTAVPSLDFEFFKTRVEPVFLKRRPGHARCYVCHAPAGEGYRSAFQLEKLSPGSTSWTEEQSRRNFEVVSRLVTPGEPLSSRLLMHPLWPISIRSGRIRLQPSMRCQALKTSRSLDASNSLQESLQ